MGSSKVLKTMPTPETMEDKKSFISALTKPIKAIAAWTGHVFQTKKKGKEEKQETNKEALHEIFIQKDDTGKNLSGERFIHKYNEIKNLKRSENNDAGYNEDDDEIHLYRILKDDDGPSRIENVNTERTVSNLSRDSGFSEKERIDFEKDQISPKNEKTESNKGKTSSKNEKTKPDKERAILESTRVDSNKGRLTLDTQRKVSERLRTNSENVKNSEKVTIHMERVRTQSEKSVIPKNAEDDVVKSLSELQIEDGKKKKKKLQTVAVSRGPILNKKDYAASSHPYSYDADSSFKQIHQINKQTFSGGQVIYSALSPPPDDCVAVKDAVETKQQNTIRPQSAVQQEKVNNSARPARFYDCGAQQSANFPKTPEQIKPFLRDVDRLYDCGEVDVAVEKVQQSAIYFPKTPEQIKEFLRDVDEFISEDISRNERIVDNTEDYVEDEFNFPTDVQESDDFAKSYCPNTVIEPNPIEEFHYREECQAECTNLDEEQYEFVGIGNIQNEYAFPTPPTSENVSSPESIHSCYPPNSDHTLSPAMSSPFNNDFERFQEIAPYAEHIPICVSELADDVTEKKAPETKASASSMTMKQYKDMQKELSMGFSKKECCQTKRKATKEIFCEHVQKLKMEKRKILVLEVAKMDLNQCYGVLQQILLSLSGACKQEDLHIVVFRLICDRLSHQKPELFVGEMGLQLLKSASLRCPSRPLLTRYLVECVRKALKKDPSLVTEEYVYREVDVHGDTLVIACARGGDAYADVLFEIAHTHDQEKPLFNVQHGNTEGHSALHVACQRHSAASSYLHVTHVLLEHAGADLWKGDVKGGDTALHLAVNSPTCDLKLIMVLFRHEDRKMWHKLSHVANRSSVTPLEYARCAAKSSTRQNYPKEVLEFMKKCR